MGKLLDERRLMPADTKQCDIAMMLYAEIKNLPIISPHGHTDPWWFAENKPFSDPASLFIKPDHLCFVCYILKEFSSKI